MTNFTITAHHIDIFHRSYLKNANGCWIWQKSKHGSAKSKASLRRVMSYGQQVLAEIGTKKRKRYLAHRLSWIIHYGEVPAGLVVMHKCDVPECCNPEHLALGTQRENLKDAADKGRLVKGKDGRFEAGNV